MQHFNSCSHQTVAVSPINLAVAMKRDRTPMEQGLVAKALRLARQDFSDADWFSLTITEQAHAIYQQLRLLGAERFRSRQQ